MQLTNIEAAKLSDSSAIMDIFIKSTDKMLEMGIKQWDYTYPTPAIVEKDILAQQVFVIKIEGIAMATITLNSIQAKQYDNIKWKYTGEKVLVIHRLAVHPNAQANGYGKQLCLFTEQYGRDNAYDLIRFDAYSGNPISLKMYERLAYEKADGLCYFHGNEIPFFCYEKEL